MGQATTRAEQELRVRRETVPVNWGRVSRKLENEGRDWKIRDRRAEVVSGAQRGLGGPTSQSASRADITGSLWWQKRGARESQLCLKDLPASTASVFSGGMNARNNRERKVTLE